VSSGLADLWKGLRSSGAETDGWIRLRVPDLPDIPLYLATHGQTGLDGLILEIPTRSVDPSSLQERTQGFEVTSGALTPGRGGTTRVILGLSAPAFQDVFRALCADIVGALSDVRSIDDAAAEFTRRLKRWQRFLQAHGSDGLSDSECLGLVGELWCLRQLLSGQVDAATALSGWTGPDREARDFALPGGDIEVKTTGSMAPTELRISSLQQLATTTDRRLVVFHLVASRNPTVGQTLPELVSDLKELVGDSIGLLEERLFAAGYLEEHRHRYEAPRYQLIAEQAFDITAAFPRLISENVPTGITKSTYSISLAAIQGFQLAKFQPAMLLEEPPQR